MGERINGLQELGWALEPVNLRESRCERCRPRCERADTDASDADFDAVGCSAATAGRQAQCRWRAAVYATPTWCSLFLSQAGELANRIIRSDVFFDTVDGETDDPH